MNSLSTRLCMLILPLLTLLPAAPAPAAPPEVTARDPALPEGTPDYSGFTIDNFMAKVPYAPTNRFGDYAMPALDPATAVVVDVAGVGAAGSDDHPGTLDKPFATLSRGIRELRAGPRKVLLLRRGSYTIDTPVQLTKELAGTAEQPLVIASFPGEVAELLGSRPLKGWRQHGQTPVWRTELPEPYAERAGVWLDGQLLRSARRALLLQGNRGGDKDRPNKPLDSDLPLTEPATFAVDGSTLYLRTPGDVHPDQLDVQFTALGTEEHGSIVARDSQWVIFDRLLLRRHTQISVSYGSPHIIFRYCAFDRARHALTFFGGDKAARGIIDHCMFHRIGDGALGSPIYNTSPVTVRNSLFRDIYPAISVTAYTSKPDGFSGLIVTGNTFVHGGATITSTGRGSIIRNNVALGSRFVSSAGTEALIEGNIAVYDPLDLQKFPHVPRRDIGFRAYGKGARMRHNTFVGFDEGGNIYKEEGDYPPVEFTGNRFYGYTKYALRVYAPEKLNCEGNLYASAGSEAATVYLTPGPEDKQRLMLAQWQAMGFDKQSHEEPGAQPLLPRVLLEAMPAPR